MSLPAAANRAVVDDFASCIEPTSSNARIGTFLVDASLVRSALRTDDTLGSASRWAALISWQARAHSLV